MAAQVFQAGREALIALARLDEPETSEVAKVAGSNNAKLGSVLHGLVKHGFAIKTQEGVRGSAGRSARWKITDEGRKFIAEKAPERLNGPSEAAQLTTTAADTLKVLRGLGTASAAEVAVKRGKTPTSGYDMMKGLMQKGLVQKDGRVFTLTPAGEELVEQGFGQLKETRRRSFKANQQAAIHDRAAELAKGAPWMTDDDGDIIDDLIEVVNAAMMVPELRPKGRRLLKYLGSRGFFA